MKMKDRNSFNLLTLLGILFLVASGCKKNTVPELTTFEVTSITGSTAESGGYIDETGGSDITAKGVCWSTSTEPTVNDEKTMDGSGVVSYTSMITGLMDNTTYYLRAYATNASGTGYGNELIFTTPQTVFTPPCNPAKNTNTRNGQTYSYYGVSAGPSLPYWGDYGLTASSLQSDLEIGFNKPPTTGAYITIDASGFIGNGECVVSGVFGTTFTYRYNADGGDTVYVVKNGEGKYSMTFCGIELRRNFTDSFTSDGNLTTD